MIAGLLQTIQQIITLQAEEVDIISSLFKERVYKKGEYFLEEGKICKQVGFIISGVMHYFITHNGEQKTYSFSKEGNFVSDYESFIPQIPSLKTIQALENCQVMTISHADLQQFYNKVLEGERFGRLVIEQVFIRTLQDLNSFYIDTPELRYKKFLQVHPDLQQRISQYHIASYVGVKPQSLSRIRKRLMKAS